MQSRQKTFALSVSRDMIPEAHLVVWHIYQGEVIADAINFFVNGTRINNVCFKIQFMLAATVTVHRMAASGSWEHIQRPLCLITAAG